MADRGIYVSIALAFAIVLLNVSFCTCVTVKLSTKSILTSNESEIVYGVMNAMVDNEERDIQLDREYYAGRLFTKYLNVNEKGVVIRLTRWSSECSVSMSQSETTKGRELLEAFKPLFQVIVPYLNRGYEWVAVSNNTDWIDYYVRDSYRQETEAPLLSADTAAYKILSEGGGSSVTDCIIKPHMLLSHHSAAAFNQLHPGDSLISPDAKYKLTIPNLIGSPCVAILTNETGNVMWHSNSSLSQANCALALRSDGTLELSNKDGTIWKTESACSSVIKCAGATSLAVKDGVIKLFKSLDDHLSVYWLTEVST